MNRPAIKRAMKKLAEVDADVASAIELVGLPEPRVRPAGFDTLLSTIVGQQISTEAAKAIRRRIDQLLPESSPDALLGLTDKALRGAGMSARKVEYAKGLATALVEGTFDLDDYIDYLVDWLHELGPDTHVLAVCQPSVRLPSKRTFHSPKAASISRPLSSSARRVLKTQKIQIKRTESLVMVCLPRIRPFHCNGRAPRKSVRRLPCEE